jgi:hypothetical protein
MIARLGQVASATEVQGTNWFISGDLLGREVDDDARLCDLARVGRWTYSTGGACRSTIS